MQNGVAAGRIVRLERLGTFYPATSNNGEAKEVDVTSSSIRETGVNYCLGNRIKKLVKDAGFTKIKKKTKPKKSHVVLEFSTRGFNKSHA